MSTQLVFTVLSLPSRRDHSRRRSIPRARVLLPSNMGGMEYGQRPPPQHRQDKEKPSSPTFMRRFARLFAAGGDEQKPRGLCEFTRWQVREAWRNRHRAAAYTSSVPGGAAPSRVCPRHTHTRALDALCQRKFLPRFSATSPKPVASLL